MGTIKGIVHIELDEVLYECGEHESNTVHTIFLSDDLELENEE